MQIGRLTAGNVPPQIRKVAKYLTPIVSTMLRRRYPTPPMQQSAQIKWPRNCSLSESVLAVIQRRKAEKYGGAERPWDTSASPMPMSAMMVGRNAGSELYVDYENISNCFQCVVRRQSLTFKQNIITADR